MIEIIGNPTFNACLRAVYAYSANSTLVSYMAEMVNPSRDFNFSLTVLELSSMGVFFCVNNAVL